EMLVKWELVMDKGEMKVVLDSGVRMGDEVVEEVVREIREDVGIVMGGGDGGITEVEVIVEGKVVGNLGCEFKE
uniref:hypothetical protein n=1 Tax=Geobacillus sp. (strain Y412MC10) TaxID=481743 RepID=UPI001642ADDE